MLIGIMVLMTVGALAVLTIGKPPASDGKPAPDP
jgi:hypothetical protein